MDFHVVERRLGSTASGASSRAGGRRTADSLPGGVSRVLISRLSLFGRRLQCQQRRWAARFCTACGPAAAFDLALVRARSAVYPTAVQQLGRSCFWLRGLFAPSACGIATFLTAQFRHGFLTPGRSGARRTSLELKIGGRMRRVVEEMDLFDPFCHLLFLTFPAMSTYRVGLFSRFSQVAVVSHVGVASPMIRQDSLAVSSRPDEGGRNSGLASCRVALGRLEPVSASLPFGFSPLAGDGPSRHRQDLCWHSARNFTLFLFSYYTVRAPPQGSGV